MNKLRLASGFIFVFLTATVTAMAQEWTQWRGPGRDVSVTKNAGKWQATEAWKNPDIAMYLSSPAFTIERRYEVAESATFAMPVLLGSNILVRDATGLMLLTAGK